MSIVTMQQAKQCIIECYKNNEPLMLTGKPGVGKTMLFDETSKDLGIGYIDFRLSNRDPVDVRGLPVPDLGTGTTKWLLPSDLPTVERHGENGMIVFEELTGVGMALQISALGIIQERRYGNGDSMPKGWVPFATGNLLTDRAGAQRMSTALANRFLHLEVAEDIKSYSDWASRSGVDPRGIAFLRFRPQLLHVMPSSPDQKAFPSPRSWTAAFKFLDSKPETRVHLMSGRVGDAHAAELEGFLRVYENLPSIDQIIADPKGARVPEQNDPATMYAVAGALARHATRKNFDAICTYAQRLPSEFQVLVAHDAVKRDAALAKTSAFGAWAVRNQEVTI